jgi:hypothetical protein
MAAGTLALSWLGALAFAALPQKIQLAVAVVGGVAMIPISAILGVPWYVIVASVLLTVCLCAYHLIGYFRAVREERKPCPTAERKS